MRVGTTSLELPSPLIATVDSKDQDGHSNMRNKLSSRLTRRKQLHVRRRLVNDIMCVVAMLGLVLMIISTELLLNDGNTSDIIIIRSCITASTAVLVGLLFYYHMLDIHFYTNNHHIRNWYITLSTGRIFLLLAEVFVCAIHPVPHIFTSTTASGASSNTDWPDMLLSLPMFTRFYLVARSLTLHSSLVDGASSLAVGYLNRVPMTISFLLRSFLQKYPTRVWSSVTVILILAAAWSMHACEKAVWLPVTSPPPDSPTALFLNALWLVLITITTVGYGDMTPETYCGRGVSILIAFFGLFASAVLIAVFTSKIALNRAEQCLIDFLDRMQHFRTYKENTMKIIHHSFRAWFLKRRGHSWRAKVGPLHQLDMSLRHGRSIKEKQRNSTNPKESLMTAFSDVQDQQRGNEIRAVQFQQRLQRMENKMNVLDTKLDNILKAIK